MKHPNQRNRLELPRDLHRVEVAPAARDWVRAAAGSPVLTVRRLPGASSTAVHALRLASGVTLVLKQYRWKRFLAEEPEAPAREAEALDFARTRGLPVPQVVAVDLGERPMLLMTRVPGQALGSPPLDLFVEVIVRVHDADPRGYEHAFSPWCRSTCTRAPEGATRPELWEHAITLWRTAEPEWQPRFVHRDLHPGNVHWSRGRPSGVVDWANACSGPAGIDVATARWNLLAWAGRDAADLFVSAYERESGRVHHPYWDLARLLEDDFDLGRPPQQVAAVERALAWVVPRVEESIR